MYFLYLILIRSQSWNRRKSKKIQINLLLLSIREHHVVPPWPPCISIWFQPHLITPTVFKSQFLYDIKTDEDPTNSETYLHIVANCRVSIVRNLVNFSFKVHFTDVSCFGTINSRWLHEISPTSATLKLDTDNLMANYNILINN